MMYGLEMMYRLLNQYAENDIDETEHAFVADLKWPDSYVLKIHDEKFWEQLQDDYDIVFTDEDKQEIATIGHLKRKISHKGH